MDFGILTVILVLIVAFLAGMEGVLDQFQFHQPIVACSLVGLATGHVTECIILGGALQFIALGWSNIGAAIAPDAALASVASSIIFVKAGNFTPAGTQIAIGSAIALATVGLILTMAVRTLSVIIVHQADKSAANGSINGVEFWHLVALATQGLRIAIPAGFLMFLPSETVKAALETLPKWLSDGMVVGGGLVVAVGFAMVINIMATKEVWPFFFLGFALAPISQLTLIATGIIGVCLAIIYLNLSKGKGGDGGSQSGDPLGDILNDY